MAIQSRIYWDHEVSYLLIGEMTGTGTWEDFHRFHDEVFAMAAESDAETIHFAFVTDVDTPKGSPFPHYAQLVRRWDAFDRKGQYFIVLSENLRRKRWIISFVNIAKQMLRRNDFPFVDSIEEARQLIHQMHMT
jgi:hypothetical protein